MLNCASRSPASCCGAPLNVAANSIDRPPLMRGSVDVICVPCSLTEPLLTVSVPLVMSTFVSQPLGNAVPENSVARVGVSITSPLPVSE